MAFGALLKSVSLLLTAGGKIRPSADESDKDLEKWTGGLDAAAVLVAFPGLFAAGADLVDRQPLPSWLLSLLGLG